LWKSGISSSLVDELSLVKSFEAKKEIVWNYCRPKLFRVSLF
jgi:hypothetical protein